MLRTVRTLAPAIAVTLAVLTGCASPRMHDTAAHEEAAAPSISPDLGKRVVTPIYDTKGAILGDAVFTQGAHGVVIRVTLAPGKLSAGWHGLHIHEKADCSDKAAGFKASGAHAGHLETIKHGLFNPTGPEPGDLPNIYVADRAPVGAELYSPYLALAAEARGGQTPLLDADGSALIIHANADDHSTQPIGGAGDRVACAALPEQK
jgi:Cu-Zn family superoxide dismutase